MQGTAVATSDPRSFEVGTEDYVEAAASRARLRPNLVDCFIAAMTNDGWVISHIPEWLNKELGLKITYPRMREWATGARQLPEEVATVMAQKAVPWILQESGVGGSELPDEVLRGLVARAFPWMAKLNLPSGKKAVRLSADKESWLVAALIPPLRKEASEVKRRQPKRAPRKVKPAKKTTAKKALSKADAAAKN